MATASVSITPECSICCEHFTTPKVLPCGHTFCLNCLEGYIADRRNTFPCPLCQQDVKIPDGGAKDFTTNFIVQTSKHTTQVRDQPPSTTQPKCPNHNQREVDYYCNNCNVGLCSKCIFKQHKDHETLDIECDETRNKTLEKLERSNFIIQNRIKNLKKNRSTLLESFEQLKFLCEESCAKVFEKTETIVSKLRTNCEQIIQDIRNNLEENRSKVEEREKEITSEINLLESNMESNISTETTLNILLTLHHLIEIEKQGENSKDYNLCLQYLRWVGKDFSLDIDQLGSVISKPFYKPGSFLFLFDKNDIDEFDALLLNGDIEENEDYPEENYGDYYNPDKFRNNNLVWTCGVGCTRDCELYIFVKLLPSENSELDYCIIDGQLSLLNIDDDSKTITKTVSDERLEGGGLYVCCDICWLDFNNKNNGYINSNSQCVVQFDITQIRDISWT